MKKYSIYLICDDKAFIRYSVLEKIGFSMKDYTKVYEGFTSDFEEKKEISQILDLIYAKFNIGKPNDYNYRSISVGDIVEIDGVKYFCDSFGWKKLENFY